MVLGKRVVIRSDSEEALDFVHEEALDSDLN